MRPSVRFLNSLAVLLPLMALMTIGVVMNPGITTLVKTFSLTSAIVFALYVVITVAAITASDYLNIRPLIRDLSRSSRKVGSRSKAKSDYRSAGALGAGRPKVFGRLIDQTRP